MKNSVKYILSLVLFLYTLNNCFAISYTSILNGNYSNPLIWFPIGVPGGSDDVTINHDVVLDKNITNGGGNAASISGTWIIAAGASLTSTTKNVTLKTGGSLTINGTFEVDDFDVSNGSTLLVGAAADIIVHGDFTNDNNSNDVTINSTSFTVKGDLSNGNGAVITGAGSITVEGTTDNNANGILFDCTTAACDCATGCASVLPIKLLSFNVYLNEEHVELNWVTSSEINNDYFTIKRSIDGINWEEILSTKGAGNSNQVLEYFETDDAPLNGTSYYRLIQTDFDGSSSYSEIVPVKNKEMKSVRLFPNPVNQESTLRLELNTDSEQEVLIVLKNMQGKEFYSKRVNTIEKEMLIAVPIDASIPRGLYLLTTTSKNQVLSQKLIIQ